MGNLLVLLLLTILTPSFVSAQVSSQPISSVDLQSQIQDLLKQIQALQQQVAALQQELGKEPEAPAGLPTQAGGASPTSATEVPVSRPEATPPELTRSLSRGSSGDDVRKLQEFLSKDKEIYPDGLITGFFGPKTEAAVKKWQEKHGIEQVGVVGPKTIAKFQELGRGVVQGLIDQGAGFSNIIPPGLLNAPGIQKKLEQPATTTMLVAATTTPPSVIPTIPVTVVAQTTSAPKSAAAIVNYTTSSSGIASNRIRSIAVDTDGSIWVGHILGKVSRFDGTNWRVYDLPLYVNPNVPTNKVPPSISTIAIDKNGNKWFATDFGLAKFDGTSWTTYSIITLQNPERLSIVSATSSFSGSTGFISAAFDKNGNGWFGSQAWHWKFDGVNWTHYTYPPYPLTGTRVYDIAVGSGNNIWFASLETIMKFDGTNWWGWAVGHQGRSRDLAMYAVEIDPNGYIWFGTDQDGVRKFDEDYWIPRGSDYSKLSTSFTTSNSGLAGNEIGVRAIAFQPNGTAWFGTRYGVSSFDGANWKTYDVENGLLSNTITAVAVDKRGNVWVGTDDRGVSLIKFDTTIATPAIPAAPAIPPPVSGSTPAASATPATPATTAATTTATTGDTTAPVISDVRAVNVTSSGATITWNTNENANSQVEYSPTTIYQTVLDVPYVSSHTMIISALSSGTTYNYRVRSTDAAGNLATSINYTFTTLSATATATTTTADTTAPSAPTNLVATAISSSQINLSWSASTDNVGVIGYHIYRNYDSFPYTSVSSTAYSNQNLSPEVKYWYAVAAYDAAGNVSAQSSWVSATTLSLSSCTTYPVISNIQATDITDKSVIIRWTTNNPANSQVEYAILGLASSFKTISTLVADHAVPIDGLNANTIYNYRVYSTCGGYIQSSPLYQFSTTAVSPPAPTNIQAVTTASSQQQPPQMWYYMTFDYTLQSTTQSFNIYRKRPTDVSFVKYTYNAQMSVNPSILPLPASGESSLYRRDPNQWSWYTTLPAPAPASAAGEYQFYVTAVDTNGVEGSPSITKSLKIYAAPAILSPADGSTISAPFTITVTGDPNAPSYSTYGMTIYKKTTGDTAWSAWPAPSTSFTYSGPALNSNDNPHRLVVWLSADGSSFSGTSVFNISSATTSSLDLRARSLAAISQALNSIREQLLKLLQGL